MKCKILSLSLCLLLALSFMSFSLYGQQKVNGIVNDENGIPIPGVNVVLKGSDTGSVTDLNGAYSITVFDITADELIFSFIGYKTETIKLNGRTQIDIQLTQDITTLENVVVIGYGTQEKRAVTGSIARADIERFKNSPNTNVVQSLQGSVSGLNIGQVNKAGQTPSISIRGQSTISGNSNALIVVDGIQYNGSLSSLNPEDIASIDVLKDASSTAVYGAQASNGVILITTKSGKKNQQPTISLSASSTVQSPTNDLRPLNRQEYLDHVRDLYYDEAYLAPGYTEPNPDFDITTRVDAAVVDDEGNLLDNNFDWWDAATQTGSINEVKASITGGSENFDYYISLGYTNQDGYIKNDEFERKSIRLNLESQVTSWLTLGVQSFGSFVNTDGAEPNVSDIIILSPLLVPYDENGELIPNPFNNIIANPFLPYDVEDYDRENYLFANIYSQIDFPFLKGLSYRLNFGNNYRVSNHYAASEYGAGLTGSAYKDHAEYYDYTLDNILSYKRQFDRHSVEVSLLYGAIERNNYSTTARGEGFTRLNLGYNNLQQADLQFANSGGWKESLLYQMARLSYGYNDKYLFTGTIRRDGFSGFADNNKYGVFPSASLGWVISEEPFLKSERVDNLKLRIGYGVSGNQTSRYNSLPTLLTRASYVFGDGGSTAFGQEVNALANPNLRWEKTTGLNIGADFALFGSRLEGAVDYYHNITDDLLFDVGIPYITGFDNISTNVGKLENKGFEFSLSNKNIDHPDFQWNTAVTFSANSNEILELTGEDNNADGKEDDLVASNLFIGESLGAIYTYETDGIYQLDDDIPDGYYPGTFRIVDQNDDGEINSDDRIIVGTSDPAFRMSLWNKFSYHNFSLSVFFNSIQGGKDGYLGAHTNTLIRDDNAIRQSYLSGIDFWSPSNPDGINPRSLNNPPIHPNLYLDRSFIRLQDVTLAYDLNQELLEKIHLQSLRIYVSGKNLATWTDWKGWDPETNEGQTSDGRPVLRSISVGLNVNF